MGLPAENKNQDTYLTHYDPAALAQVMADVMEKSQPLVQEYLNKYTQSYDENAADPFNLQEAYAEFLSALLSDPQRLAELQMEYWSQWLHLWHQTTSRLLGEQTEDIYKPEKGDRRFKSKAWQENALYDFIKQSYLMTSRWMHKVVVDTEGLDKDTVEKIDFYTRQFADAMAPTNFVLTNPDVLEETIKSRGENLVRGLENLLRDMERGAGELKIRTTDYEAFELGKNIAVTPGCVVYQNDLMQLIQYEPSTEKAFKRPLLVIPPWINKYYILDLKSENSFIKWLVDQGHTVFVVSWVNPTPKLAQKRFEDYMDEGIIDALDQIEKITGEKDVNAIGYCIGGTLLSITMSWLATHKQDSRIASATMLTTLIDFEQAGELKLFTDDRQLALLDREMAESGVLQGKELQKTFSLLRANDLIWSFVINNYLMGKEPFPFDLLYWNDDSTNMPAAMHSFYLRKMYRDNLLVQPGGIEMEGTPIDIRTIKTPCYFLSAREDHIAPWKATYAGATHFKGKCTFTLAASGHIAGVVNPPQAEKYGYWTADGIPAEADKWLEKAQEHKGSWWPHWQSWIKDYTGPKVPARKPKKGIEAAPGSYVKVKT